MSLDSQSIFMVLVLPAMFGMTVEVEGLYGILKRKRKGWYQLLLGFSFVILVSATYAFFLTKNGI